MEAKEKAEALLNKFTFASIYFTDKENGAKLNAKTCALLAVDEVINEYESKICNSGYDYDFERWDMQRDYWIEVKQELEKL